MKAILNKGLINIVDASGALVAWRNVFGCWLDAKDSPIYDGRKTRAWETRAQKELGANYSAPVDQSTLNESEAVTPEEFDAMSKPEQDAYLGR